MALFRITKEEYLHIIGNMIEAIKEIERLLDIPKQKKAAIHQVAALRNEVVLCFALVEEVSRKIRSHFDSDDPKLLDSQFRSTRIVFYKKMKYRYAPNGIRLSKEELEILINGLELFQIGAIELPESFFDTPIKAESKKFRDAYLGIKTKLLKLRLSEAQAEVSRLTSAEFTKYPYLDEGHPNFAPKLKIAIDAWMGIFSERKTKKISKAAFKAKYLTKYTSDQSNDVIARVINPHHNY